MNTQKMSLLCKLIFGMAMFYAMSVVAAPEEYSIVYSANLDGELEPCGCSIEGNSGGILRRAQTLDLLRAEDPNIFALSAGGLINNSLTEERLKSRYIFDGYAQIGYDAVGVQWSDIRYGVDFTKHESMSWVSSNWLGNDFEKSRIVKRGDKTLAFFSWLAPELSPYRAMQGHHAVVDASIEPLLKELKQARKLGMLVVVTSTYTLEQAQQQLPLEYIDVLMIKSAYEEYTAPKMLDGTLLLQAGSRGLRLGKLDIEFSAGEGISAWQHEVISLPPMVANAERLEAWYQAYNDDVAAAYNASVIAKREARKSGIVSPFIGEKACKACHTEEHAVFKKTRHAKAFSTLERVNKAFDPECIACHSVGFNKKGGFIDVESTKHLKNVQCESCHGEGRAHAESAGKMPLGHENWQPTQMCAQCHTQPHSPVFDFADYLTKIRH